MKYFLGFFVFKYKALYRKLRGLLLYFYKGIKVRRREFDSSVARAGRHRVEVCQ